MTDSRNQSSAGSMDETFVEWLGKTRKKLEGMMSSTYDFPSDNEGIGHTGDDAQAVLMVAECEYCHKRHDTRIACPAYAAYRASQPSPAATVEMIETGPVTVNEWEDASRPQCSAVIADDPTASKEWNEGCDFAMEQLCRFLGVDPSSVSWDAATETVDGDVQAVIGNILCAKFGEDWGPNETLPEGVSVSSANKAIEFCAWLSGYIGHGPAVRISSDQMDYIRSKVHPLMVDLGVMHPPSAPTEPQPSAATEREVIAQALCGADGNGFLQDCTDTQRRAYMIRADAVISVLPQPARVSLLDDELLIEWGQPDVAISIDDDGFGYAIRRGNQFEPGVSDKWSGAVAEIRAALSLSRPHPARGES